MSSPYSRMPPSVVHSPLRLAPIEWAGCWRRASWLRELMSLLRGEVRAGLDRSFAGCLVRGEQLAGEPARLGFVST